MFQRKKIAIIFPIYYFKLSWPRDVEPAHCIVFTTANKEKQDN